MFVHRYRPAITGTTVLLASLLGAAPAWAHDAEWPSPASVTISYGAHDGHRYARHQDDCDDRNSGYRHQRKRHGHDYRHRSRHGYGGVRYESRHDRYRSSLPRGETVVILKYRY